ncbi:DUF6489 family protein [Rhodospirillum rubrum]|uniref:Ribosomal protein S1 n=1 Tax=Rhodospirillum rubrum (strain ATCC 11170 / ATH 1.1.1 / DSM 467 / LMG 4362 / NCIMB 8255 / S1) TaxID=269796 RepID=Q2RN78_RHORT|nr:DUF6489 family protein [Rhodospirillum rubrum]ABC24417.1 hypothetical protein Rru_A3623 [Rhodospirillum rubrum ATCC 11170]AEO50168.1 hypothetical protein F11_18540 [Rhodospirillum rubrum F11]MBK5956137.1 hypothetical protein [Rhodospirillum rubrum]QXG80340.1 hypothetical protein KUL73_18695 [Rhodospirillum rubrum]HAP99795.1 hypothetical protein [Rhodospirillum rubrum]
MKVTVDVDCTPEEARAFLGLPDVQPMQQALLKQMQDRLSANLGAMEPEALLKTWLPTQVSNIGALQDFFWSQFAKAASGATGKSDPRKPQE